MFTLLYFTLIEGRLTTWLGPDLSLTRVTGPADAGSGTRPPRTAASGGGLYGRNTIYCVCVAVSESRARPRPRARPPARACVPTSPPPLSLRTPRDRHMRPTPRSCSSPCSQSRRPRNTLARASALRQTATSGTALPPPLSADLVYLPLCIAQQSTSYLPAFAPPLHRARSITRARRGRPPSPSPAASGRSGLPDLGSTGSCCSLRPAPASAKSGQLSPPCSTE